MSTSFEGLGATLPPPMTIHLSVEVKRSGLACGPRYRRYRANGVRHRIKAKRVRGIYYRASRLIIRCPSRVDDAVYGACGRIHDPFGTCSLSVATWTLAAALGSNSQISFVEATLMLNPPRMYSLLLATVKPPAESCRRHPQASRRCQGGPEYQWPDRR